jgi:hypothetical protein
MIFFHIQIVFNFDQIIWQVQSILSGNIYQDTFVTISQVWNFLFKGVIYSSWDKTKLQE